MQLLRDERQFQRKHACRKMSLARMDLRHAAHCFPVHTVAVHHLCHIHLHTGMSSCTVASRCFTRRTAAMMSAIPLASSTAGPANMSAAPLVLLKPHNQTYLTARDTTQLARAAWRTTYQVLLLALGCVGLLLAVLHLLDQWRLFRESSTKVN